MKGMPRIRRSAVAWCGLVAGPVLAGLSYVALPMTYVGVAGDVISFGDSGRATAAVPRPESPNEMTSPATPA
jgi:hypothetical protein